MTRADVPDASLDLRAVAMIAALVIVIGPATILASVFILTHGFEPAATTRFEWIVTVLVSLLALVMIRAGVRELRGGLGVRVDARGVHRGRLSIAWAEVERVDSPSFGTLEIIAKNAALRVQTYLFRDSKQLHDYIITMANRRSERPAPV